MYNAESTNKHTPDAFNNVESNDFVANRLLLFEHVKMPKNTDLLRTTITRSYNLLVYKDDDVTVGSDVFQPEGLVQVSRDVVNNVFGSITCIVFHFQGANCNHQYVLLLPWTPDE